MWEVHGRVAFWAEEAGATSVVLLDAMDPSEEFAAEHARRGSEVKFFQGDVHDLDALRTIGTFDVVWCTGVLYHTPNPYLQLRNLREITDETLVLGSHVIPELPGIEQASIFYPGMSAAARAAFAEVHDRASEWSGMAAPFDYTPMMGYANNWWGLTPSAVIAMLELARFDVLDTFAYGPFAMDLVATAANRPDVVPPDDFIRRRFQDLVDHYGPGDRPAWLLHPSASDAHSSPVTPQ